MKKLSMLMAAFCAGMLFGAELPDFSKAETWKSTWTKSISNFKDGVMTIERPEGVVPDGSGAWQSVWFEVKPGEVFSGSVDVHFITKGNNRAHGRIGIDFYGANNKRVQFFDCANFYQTNNAFETKNFTCKPAPEGAVKACVFLCIDAFGKIEYKNVKLSR